MDVEELDRRLAAAIAAFDVGLRRELARILELPDVEQAASIGGLHRSSKMPQLAELLVDLEEDKRVRRIVLAELHSQIRS